MKNIKVLDCTLRDGGLALEDAHINKYKHKIFTHSIKKKFLKKVQKTKIEIIEIGSIEISKENKKKFSIYQSIQDVSQSIPKNKSKNQIYTALFKGPDTPIENIPKWKPSYCEGIRVIIRYLSLIHI